MKKYGFYNYRGRLLATTMANDMWAAANIFMKKYGYSLYKGDIIEIK